MRRATLALFLLPALTAAAAAQEVVRLKNGRFVAGTVAVDESDKEGFKVQRWDTGSTLYVRWAQITETERLRLLNKTPDAGPTFETIDGVYALTQTREVVGILVKEDANQIQVKTKDSKTPVPVPKSALLRPHEARKIKESDAYSTDEMIDARAARASDYASNLEVGKFAAGLKHYERAKEFYTKALAADPAKKDEIDPILAQNEILIKEGKASAMLAGVRELIENTEYAKAIDLAKKLLAEFSDTETARQNKDLVAQVEREAKDFEVRKAEILAQKVPEMYKAKRQSYYGQYSASKHKISEARTLAGKIDEQVTNDLAKMLKSTPDEIKAAWEKRDASKVRTANYGTGSWIVKGGQDGGLDTDQKYTPPPPQQQQNNNNNGGFNQFMNQQNRNRQPQQAKPVDLGKKLESSAEWWTNASSTDRKNFVEAEYARNSGAVKKEEKIKKCTQCQGEGTLKATRGPGVPVEVKCPRCHGAKEELSIIYG